MFKVKEGIRIGAQEFVDSSRNVAAGTITASDVTISGELRGPATMYIDPAAVGDNTGTLVIRGNLQVDGTTTTINSTTVAIDDLNIQLAADAPNAAAANGAGISVGGASATFTYASSGDKWQLNKPLQINSDDGVKAVFGGTDGQTWLRGWGLESDRGTAYYRPTGNATQTLRIGYGEASQSWATVRVDATTFTHNGNTIWTAGNLTNLNQLTNGPGYITGYTETDTLASVTGRGASTTSLVTFAYNTANDPLSAVHITGGGTHTGLYINPAASSQAHIRFGTNGTLKWQIRAPFQESATTPLKIYNWDAANDIWTLDNSGNNQVTSSFRAPIFYDSNDTGYYLNPNSTSRLSSIDFGNAGYYIHAGDWGMRNTTPYGWIQLGPANTGHAHIYTDRSNFYFNVNDLYTNGNWQISENYTQNGKYLGSDGSIRANIFYDQADTSYYLDPNSNSKFVNLGLGGATPDVRLSVSGDAHISGTLYMGGTAGSYNSWGSRDYTSSGNRYFNANTYEFNNYGYGSTWNFYINGNGAVSNVSMRAPIFYDSDNTGYYIDPNSITSLRTVGSWRSDSSTWDGEFSGKIQYHNSYWYFQAANGWLFRNSAGNNVANIDNSGTISGNYIMGTYFNSSAGNSENPTIGQIWTQSTSDNYLRKSTPAHFISHLGLLTTSNSYANTISISRINFTDTAGSQHSDPYCLRWIPETSARGNGLSWLEFQLNDDSNEEIRIYGNSCVGYGCGQISDNLYHRFRADGYAWNAGTHQADGDSRAPIFYDSNDTTYYTDPNSTSWLRHLSVGDINAANDGGWNARLNLTGSSHARLDVKSNSDGIVTTMYSHTGQGVGRVGTYSNHPLILMAQGGAEGGTVYNGSLRSSIFYDSGNTSYYVDPADGGFNLRGGTSNRVTYSTNDSGFRVNNAEGNGVSDVRLGAAWGYPGVYSSTYLMLGSENYIEFRTQNVQRGYIDNSANLFAYGSMRSPIFYDYNNTSYWGDFNDISKMYSVQAENLGGAVLNRVTSNIGVATGYREAITFIDGSTVQAHVSTKDGSGGCYQWYTTEWIYVDPEKDYEFSFWVRSDGTANIYFGWNEHDGSGNTISSNPYFSGGGINTNSTWVKRTALLRNWRTPSSTGDTNGSDRYASTTSRNSGPDVQDGVMHSATRRVQLRFGTCYGGTSSGQKTYFHLASIREVTGHDRQTNILTLPYFNGSNYSGSMNLRTFTSWDSVSGIDLIGGSGEFRMSSDSGQLNLRVDGWMYAYDSSYFPFIYDQQDTSYYVDPNSTSYQRSLFLGAHDSGSSEFRFGEDSENWYGDRWYWDSGFNVYRYSRYAGTDSLIHYHDTRDASRITYGRNIVFNDYGKGIVGLYDSTRYQGVFAMGDSYKLPANGTTTGSLYGLAWSHPNAGGTAGNLNTHGLLVLENGGFLAAVSGSIRARDDMRAPIFYDQNDTGYYIDPNSTSNSALRMRGGALFGPNVTWGAYLYVGTDGRQGLIDSGNASVSTTNGNLHLDAASGYNSYINWYDGNDLLVGAGDSSTQRLRVFGSSNYTEASGSLRAPIFYDSNDTSYYLDPNSASTSLQVAGTIEQGNNYAHPNIDWGASSTSTGMVIFYIPGDTNNYGMVHMVFDIYEYASPRVATVIIGGHNWYGGWYNTASNVVGYTDKQVRLGVKDGRYVVVFGTSGSSWSYGQIRLRKIQNGSYYNNIMDLGGNWSTTQTTTESFSNISGDLRNFRTPSALEVDGIIYGYSDIRTPIYYDYNDTGYYCDPNGNSRLNAVYPNNIYNYGWFRNQYSGEGLYNTANDAHFYSAGPNYWHINPDNGSVSVGGLIFYDQYNSTQNSSTGRRGSVYWDSAGFGLLDSTGNWSVNIHPTNYGRVTIGGHNGINPYDGVTGIRLMFGGGDNTAAADYYIGTNLESFGGTYNKLDIRWHTGIRMGAQPNYGGVRIYDSEDMGTIRFSVNKGDAHTRVESGDFYAANLIDRDDSNYYLNPNGSSRLGSTYTDNSYTYGWFRTYGTSGLYNESYGNHWYATGNDYWNLAGNNTVNVGILFRTGGHQGPVRGYVYADSSNNIGFLNSGGSWRLRVVGDDYSLADGSSMRAQIFYDSNNTAYYGDFASTTYLNKLRVNNASGPSDNTYGTAADIPFHLSGNNTTQTTLLIENTSNTNSQYPQIVIRRTGLSSLGSTRTSGLIKFTETDSAIYGINSSTSSTGVYDLVLESGTNDSFIYRVVLRAGTSSNIIVGKDYVVHRKAANYQVVSLNGGVSIDCSQGNFFTTAISSDSTFTFSNVISTGDSLAYSFTLELAHSAGTVTWPASVKWPGNVLPSLTTGKTHLFMFVTRNGGSRWRGSFLSNYDT